jgi:hypothetical protein
MGQIVDAVLRAAKTRLDLTDLFRRNACMKHGVPWDESQQQTVSVVHTYQGQATPQGSSGQNTSPQQTSTAQQTQTDTDRIDPQKVAQVAEKTVGVVRKLWPWITAAVLAAGGAGSGVTYWMTFGESRPESVATSTSVSPANPPQTQVPSANSQTTTSDGDHSLLQYLEDKGMHLPKGRNFNDGSDGATSQ